MRLLCHDLYFTGSFWGSSPMANVNRASTCCRYSFGVYDWFKPSKGFIGSGIEAEVFMNVSSCIGMYWGGGATGCIMYTGGEIVVGLYVVCWFIWHRGSVDICESGGFWGFLWGGCTMFEQDVLWFCKGKLLCEEFVCNKSAYGCCVLRLLLGWEISWILLVWIFVLDGGKKE